MTSQNAKSHAAYLEDLGTEIHMVPVLVSELECAPHDFLGRCALALDGRDQTELEVSNGDKCLNGLQADFN